jgi:hypothetical protein
MRNKILDSQRVKIETERLLELLAILNRDTVAIQKVIERLIIAFFHMT